MPVRFFVDPEIVLDENAKDIGEIILSYTFFPALETILLRVVSYNVERWFGY